MVSRSIARLAVAAFVFAMAARLACSQTYTITALPTLGGKTGQAFAINASGHKSPDSPASIPQAPMPLSGKLRLGPAGGNRHQ